MDIIYGCQLKIESINSKYDFKFEIADSGDCSYSIINDGEWIWSGNEEEILAFLIGVEFVKQKEMI